MFPDMCSIYAQLDTKPNTSVQSHIPHHMQHQPSGHGQRSGSTDVPPLMKTQHSGSDVPVSPITVLMARSGVIGSDWQVSSEHSGDRHQLTSSPTNMFTGQSLSSGQDLNIHGSSTFSPQSHSSPSSTMFPPPVPSQSFPPPVSSLYTGGPYPQSTTSLSSRTVASGSPLTPHLPAPLSPANFAGGRMRLTDLAPTTTIHHVLSLFFDYIWPLTPCVHRPRLV